MVEETRAFVGEMIQEDLSVRNLIHADFAMVNERLARFYGMGNLPVKRGGGLQKVALGEYRRGGLITQGAILKVTANGNTVTETLFGGTSHEMVTLYAQDGDDELVAKSDMPAIPLEFYGGAGSDRLEGGTENDLLDGGAGEDVVKKTRFQWVLLLALVVLILEELFRLIYEMLTTGGRS